MKNNCFGVIFKKLYVEILNFVFKKSRQRTNWKTDRSYFNGVEKYSVNFIMDSISKYLF